MKYLIISPILYNDKRLVEGDSVEMNETDARPLLVAGALEAVASVPTLAEFVKAGLRAELYAERFFGLKPGDVYDESVVAANRRKAEEEQAAEEAQRKAEEKTVDGKDDEGDASS